MPAQCPVLPDLTRLSRDQISTLLEQHRLALTVDEILTIQRDILGRPSTLAEAVLWSIQGSEHCSYRSSRHLLKQLPTDGPDVILGPSEDAGIVAVAKDHAGRRYGVAISHESHNHPSQLVPYEGAATGVGGNIRDVCCMGAEVIAIADGLRFGAISRPETRWLHEGVVAGIAGYGNPVGVPTLAGDLYYDAGYQDNCLVTVVTLGIVREDEIIHSYAPKNATDHVFILVGKPTDNSGFGGASFASKDLGEDAAESERGAVQEPNAFLERHLLKASYALFKKIHERGLTTQVGFKDLGAGGIACASVELADAAGYGAEIDLDAVPRGMKDLPAHVVLCSETQERFMWVVPPDCVDWILNHYNREFALPDISAGAMAAVIGHIRHDGLYVVKSADQEIVRAKASDVTAGIRQERPVKARTQTSVEPHIADPEDGNALLLALLSHENIASREPVYECYDKQVQGRTVIEAGCADAGVMQPFDDDSFPAEIRATGIALSLDQCPGYNCIDPYWGAVNAVVEAARNVTAVGAVPAAISDCLCFGSPEKPEQMWEFSQSVKGIADAARALQVPVVAGNVSFYNESAKGAIPPSPMIGCLGVLADVNKRATASFQSISSVLLLTRARQDECGGSVYYALHGETGASVPKPDLGTIRAELAAVHKVIHERRVQAVHDISGGGLAVALAKMSFKNKIGVNVSVAGSLSRVRKLFSETGGFVLEVPPSELPAVEKIFLEAGLSPENIGTTHPDQRLRMQGWIDLSIDEAAAAFATGLRDKLSAVETVPERDHQKQAERIT